jgi:hypothetical protein
MEMDLEIISSSRFEHEFSSHATLSEGHGQQMGTVTAQLNLNLCWERWND